MITVAMSAKEGKDIVRKNVTNLCFGGRDQKSLLIKSQLNENGSN
jgi:hypothetical protein